MKEIKEGLENKKDVVMSMMILPNIVKIYLSSNVIIRLIIILTKISISNFVGTSKLILKFMWRGERPKVAFLPKLQSWRKCDTGKRTGEQIKRTEQKGQKQTQEDLLSFEGRTAEPRWPVQQQSAALGKDSSEVLLFFSRLGVDLGSVREGEMGLKHIAS